MTGEVSAGPVSTYTSGPVADINPGAGSGISNSVDPEFTAAGNRVFFVADDGVNGKEVWVSDGRPGGSTQMAKDINPAPGVGSNPRDLVTYQGEVYFSADDGVSGTEIWRVTGDSTVKFKLPSAAVRVDRAGRATLKVRCAASEISGPCRGTVVVKTRSKVKTGGKRRQVVIGKALFTAEPGKAGRVSLKLSPKVRRLVRKSGQARRVSVRVKARDGVGNTSTLTRNARLTGPGAR